MDSMPMRLLGGNEMSAKTGATIFWVVLIGGVLAKAIHATDAASGALAEEWLESRAARCVKVFARSSTFTDSLLVAGMDPVCEEMLHDD